MSLTVSGPELSFDPRAEKAGVFFRLGARHGIVARAYDGADLLVSWDDDPPGVFSSCAPEVLVDARAEFRFCPHGWDAINRCWRPGEEMRHARARRVLKSFGL